MKRIAPVFLMASVYVGSTATRAVAADPLDVRVTIDYRAAPAADVIKAIAAAAGLRVEIGAGTLRPVTITLTNVRLSTALHALCENANCSWTPVQGTVKVTPLPSEKAGALPPQISFSLDETPASDVFRAVAAAIDVPVTVEPSLPNQPVTMNFKSAATAEVLNLLCNMLQCSWDFDPQRGLRVMQKR